MKIDEVDGLPVVEVSKTFLANAEFCLLRHEQFGGAGKPTWPMVYGQDIHELIESIHLFPSKEVLVEQFTKNWRARIRERRFRRQSIEGDRGLWGRLLKQGQALCARIYDRYNALPPPREPEVGFCIAFGFPSRPSLRFLFTGRFDAVTFDESQGEWVIREYKSRTWESKLEPIFYVGSFLLLAQHDEFRRKVGMSEAEALEARDNPGTFIRRIRLEYHSLDSGTTSAYRFDYPTWLKLLLHIEHLQEWVLHERGTGLYPINLANCWRCPAKERCDEFFLDKSRTRAYQEPLIVDRNIRFRQPPFAARPKVDVQRLDFSGRTVIGARKRPIPRRLAIRRKLLRLRQKGDTK